MSNNKISNAALKKVEEQDKKNNDNEVREGQEDSSIWGNNDQPDKNTYPNKDESEKQYNEQEEFKKPSSNQSEDVNK